MAVVERLGIFSELPKNVVLGAIHVISSSLLQDASTRLKGTGLKTDLKTEEDFVETIVKYFPYHYHFRWELEEKNGNKYVKLRGKTPGRFWEPLFEMNFKLESVVDTQWAALTNFAIGYMTAKRGFARALSTEKKTTKKKKR